MNRFRELVDLWNETCLYAPLRSSRLSPSFRLERRAQWELGRMADVRLSVCRSPERRSLLQLVRLGVRFGAHEASWTYEARAAVKLHQLIASEPGACLASQEATGRLLVNVADWHGALVDRIAAHQHAVTFAMKYDQRRFPIL